MVLLRTVSKWKVITYWKVCFILPSFFSALSFEIRTNNGNSWHLCMTIIHEKVVYKYTATNGNACTCLTNAIFSTEQMRKKILDKF